MPDPPFVGPSGPSRPMSGWAAGEGTRGSNNDNCERQSVAVPSPTTQHADAQPSGFERTAGVGRPRPYTWRASPTGHSPPRQDPRSEALKIFSQKITAHSTCKGVHASPGRVGSLVSASERFQPAAPSIPLVQGVAARVPVCKDTCRKHLSRRGGGGLDIHAVVLSVLPTLDAHMDASALAEGGEDPTDFLLPCIFVFLHPPVRASLCIDGCRVV